METQTATSNREHFQRLVDELKTLEEQLRQGGGPERIAREHKKGKLTARERIRLLFDEDAYFQETGLLIAYDQYDGQAPAAGVVTGIGHINGREAVVVANDATVKAGSWWPETVRKVLRLQEIAMRCRVPIVYLVDSAGVNLPYQSGVFPGQYGGGRIFFYNSVMRRYLKVPQLAAVMGPCVAGGAYLPALSDLIIMVEGTSFMGLGGPNLVKGAVGQTVDSETLGGARTHNEISGVAHYKAKDDSECVLKLREFVTELPLPPPVRVKLEAPREPARPLADIYDIMPANHRGAYDMRDVLACLLDAGELDEFQADYAKEMLCGFAHIEGIPVGIIANQRRRRPPAEVRRHHLHRFGGKGRLFHRDLQSPSNAAALFAGCGGLHGRHGRRAFGHHSRRRAIRRSDGDGDGAEDRADAQPRIGRWLLRDGRSRI
jgi:acetyl-CoA carboxylase carboxyltransferase component